MATRSKRGGARRGKQRSKRFSDLPNHQRMRKRSPESAPRLYEWLVDNGYIEAVPTYRRKTANRQVRRR